MISNRLWIVEYKASNGRWYPTLPREWFGFKKEALKEMRRRRYEDGNYRAAPYCAVKP